MNQGDVAAAFYSLCREREEDEHRWPFQDPCPAWLRCTGNCRVACLMDVTAQDLSEVFNSGRLGNDRIDVWSTRHNIRFVNDFDDKAPQTTKCTYFIVLCHMLHGVHPDALTVMGGLRPQLIQGCLCALLRRIASFAMTPRGATWIAQGIPEDELSIDPRIEQWPTRFAIGRKRTRFLFFIIARFSQVTQANQCSDDLLIWFLRMCQDSPALEFFEQEEDEAQEEAEAEEEENDGGQG